MNPCMDGYYCQDYYYTMPQPPMPFGNMGMPPQQQGGRRRKKREYYENAPHMFECTIAPVEEQGNKEFEAVRAFAAGIAAVLALACPESKPEPEPEPEPCPIISTPVARKQLSPRKVSRSVKAVMEKLLQSDGEAFDEAYHTLVEVFKGIGCLAGLEKAAECLLTYGTDYKHLRPQVAELIAALNGFATISITEKGTETEVDGLGEADILQLGVGKRSVDLGEIVSKMVVEELESCCGCDTHRVISFAAELVGHNLATAEVVKAAVCVISLGALEYDEYVDPATPQEQLTASPSYYRSVQRKIEEAHCGLMKSPHFHDAVVFAAHISEFYLPDDEECEVRHAFHAKSSPLPVIEA